MEKPSCFVCFLVIVTTQAKADVVSYGTNIAIDICKKDISNKQDSIQAKNKPNHIKKNKPKGSSKILGNFKLLIPNKLR